MADTKTDRLQQIVNEHAAALGMPPGRVTWSWMPRYPDFRPKNFDLVMFDDRAEHFDANRLDAVSLMLRKAFGVPIEERGLKWWGLREVYKARLDRPLTIAFGEVATHNHFVLDRGGKVFKQTAPVIKLPAGSSEDAHLGLLGLLVRGGGGGDVARFELRGLRLRGRRGLRLRARGGRGGEEREGEGRAVHNGLSPSRRWWCRPPRRG